MRPHRRTTLATALVMLAVLLPLSAWWISGSRDARRRATDLLDHAAIRARQAAEREAARLGTRLEVLRQQEAERPFYQYQSLYHDPRGAAQGLAVTPSPLTSRSADPLVSVHFQIDETGLVTLPAVNERFPELTSDADFDRFCTLLGDLQQAFLVEAAAGEGRPVEDDRYYTLSDTEWQQILRADSVYASITGRSKDVTGEELDLGHDGAADHRVVIRVGPLTWRTMVLGTGSALAALREVETPQGILLQGFTIAPAAVDQWLGNSATPLEFTTPSSATEDAVTALVGDTGWVLVAAVGPELRTARELGRDVILQFRRTYGFIASAVLIAAIAVVSILLQIDRVARQRARFAAAAAHELKTPLSGIMLHSEMLTENLGDPEHRARYAAIVASEAERLGRVVANMLDLSRLERGVPLAHPVPGNVTSAVERCVNRLRSGLAESGLEVDLSTAEDVPDAVFDPDALCQILDNLLDNAEKHTRTTSERKAEVSVAADDRRVRITVSDNGPGIPRHLQRSLFAPFKRPHASRQPGLGLGLALARSLARAQGGELALDSSVKQGASFVLELPVA